MRPRTAVVALMLLVAALVAGNVGVSRVRAVADLTARRTATLSESTREVLDSVDRPLRVTVFFGRDDVGRVEAATLLERYRRFNRRVSWR